MPQDAIEHLQAARRILAQHHDIIDVGPANEHPSQGPNWAMCATDAIETDVEETEWERDMKQALADMRAAFDLYEHRFNSGLIRVDAGHRLATAYYRICALDNGLQKDRA